MSREKAVRAERTDVAAKWNRSFNLEGSLR